MSGSNLICAVTALVETGAVAVQEPTTELRVDTAVGTVAVRAQIANGRAVGVTFDNVPAFVVALDHPLELPGYGTVPVDIVFGGQFYVQAKAADLGVELVPSAAKELARAGSYCAPSHSRSFPVQHPLNPDIDHVALTMIHGPSPTPGRSGRNTVVLPNGTVDLDDPNDVDRDAGPIALRHRDMRADGRPPRPWRTGHRAGLRPRRPARHYIHRTPQRETQIGSYRAVLPSLSGRGWITGFNTYVLAEDDPFPRGYTVADLWGPEPAGQ